MNKIFTLLLTALFLTSLASAIVTETNHVFEGVLQGDIEIESDIPVNNVSVLGLICSNADCSGVQGRVFPDILNTGSDNSIILEYPTELISPHGYGIYFFKPGFIPYEVNADWSGNGNAGEFDNFLFKKAFCTAEITNFQTQGSVQIGQTVETFAVINSAINTAGPLEFVPEEIEEHYQNSVDIFFEVTDLSTSEIVASEFTSLNIDFSGQKEIGLEWIATQTGDFKVSIKTLSNDDKCISAEEVIQSQNVAVSEIPEEGDTTPPVITIESPESITYATSNIPIVVSTDEQSILTFTLDNSNEEHISSDDGLHFFLLLEDLSDGLHTLILHASDASGNVATAFVDFSVDTTTPDTTPPVITIESPESITYTISNIPIIASTNEQSILLYFLDGADEIQISSDDGFNFNFLLEDLENGDHTLTFQAVDLAANHATETVEFTVTVDEDDNDDNDNEDDNGDNDEEEDEKDSKRSSKRQVTHVAGFIPILEDKISTPVLDDEFDIIIDLSEDDNTIKKGSLLESLLARMLIILIIVLIVLIIVASSNRR
jgi:hypothetical protein